MNNYKSFPARKGILVVLVIIIILLLSCCSRTPQQKAAVDVNKMLYELESEAKSSFDDPVLRNDVHLVFDCFRRKLQEHADTVSMPEGLSYEDTKGELFHTMFSEDDVDRITDATQKCYGRARKLHYSEGAGTQIFPEGTDTSGLVKRIQMMDDILSRIQVLLKTYVEEQEVKTKSL